MSAQSSEQPSAQPLFAIQQMAEFALSDAIGAVAAVFAEWAEKGAGFRVKIKVRVSTSISPCHMRVVLQIQEGKTGVPLAARLTEHSFALWREIAALHPWLFRLSAALMAWRTGYELCRQPFVRSAF